MDDVWTGPLPLTHRQMETLQVLYELIAQQGLRPTYAQIGTELDMMSKGAVCGMLHKLEEKGWITIGRQPDGHRLHILHPPPAMPDFSDLEFVLVTDMADIVAEQPPR